MDTMGERIIYLRECLDMRQNELADRIGVTKMTMYKYEKNLCEPRGAYRKDGHCARDDLGFPDRSDIRPGAAREEQRARVRL